MSRHFDRLLVPTVSAAVLLVLCGSLDAGGCRRRAVCSNALPCYDYQAGVSPIRGTLASYPAVVSEVPDDSVPAFRTKRFQALAENLTVGDCTLENVQLLLDSDGNYVLSFRAINGANSAEPAQKSQILKAGAAKLAERIPEQVIPVRHHRIRVTASLFTGSAAVPARETARASGVLLVRLAPSSFLINAAEQQTLTLPGRSVTSRQFALADQVEFELEIDPVVPPLEARGARAGSVCR